jgi:Domain of unknown function DUF11
MWQKSEVIMSNLAKAFCPGARQVEVRARLASVILVVIAIVFSLGVTTSMVVPAGAATPTDYSPWSVLTSPNTSSTQDNELLGVSCGDPSTCVAVGDYTNGRRGSGTAQTLIESWNGSVWSIVPSPNTSATVANILSAVSCSGPSNCTAAGYAWGGTFRRTLIEAWNGSVWSIVPSPNTSPTDDNTLNAISCTGPSACMAVGYNSVGHGQTLIESWNGAAWAIVTSPNVSGNKDEMLNGVSCISPTACTAVGNDATISPGNVETLIESWNGASWAIVPSPNPSGGEFNDLNGVSCSGPSACMASGASISLFFHARLSETLMELWNGTTWSIVPSPNSTTSPNQDLDGVSCSESSACTAVGTGTNIGGRIIESWDGSVVSNVPSPMPANGGLVAVSCSGRGTCFAVGSSGRRLTHTLVEKGGQASADLRLTQTAKPSPKSETGQATAREKVSNLGLEVASRVTFTDLIASPTFKATTVTSSQSGASCQSVAPPTGYNGKEVCTLSSLPRHMKWLLTLTLSGTSGGSVTNSVSVSAQPTDPDISNNQATNSTTFR